MSDTTRPKNSFPIEARSAVRRPYVTPRLIAYGLIRDLTASGSGMRAEGVSGMGSAMKHT